MARVRRQFDRLDELEREYRSLIAKVCRKELDHEFSKAATRTLRPGLLDGKFWRDKEAAHLEYLEKEIRGLRQKLSVPLSESPVFEVAQMRDEYRGQGDGERRRLLSDFIARQAPGVVRAK